MGWMRSGFNSRQPEAKRGVSGQPALPASGIESRSMPRQRQRGGVATEAERPRVVTNSRQPEAKRGVSGQPALPASGIESRSMPRQRQRGGGGKWATESRSLDKNGAKIDRSSQLLSMI